MKNKASLMLMELLIMVLVFSLATAICLRLFVAADRLSEEISRQDRAVILAQNAAEALKAGKTPKTTLEELTLTVDKVSSGIPGLNQAEITVYHGKTVVFSLTTGWQEVGK